MHITRLIGACRTANIFHRVSSNQVRFFRHQPEDMSRPLGRPEKKELPTKPSGEETPVQEAKVISSPISSASHIKDLAKQYGPVAFGVFVGVSLMNLGFCYICVKFGIASQLADHHKVVEMIEKYPMAQASAEFILAYAIHKALAPMRYGITGALTPVVVNFLRSKGWLKKLYKKT